jgi:hypothetical protein
MPMDVLENLKRVAPLKGMSGYQALIKFYISEGLREDLETIWQREQANSLESALAEIGLDEEWKERIQSLSLAAPSELGEHPDIRSTLAAAVRILIHSLKEQSNENVEKKLRELRKELEELRSMKTDVIDARLGRLERWVEKQDLRTGAPGE